ANRYFDRDFLKVEPDDVKSVTLQRPGQPVYTFTHGEGDKWTLSPNPGNKPVDPTAASGFVRSLVNVRMVDPHGKQVTPDMGLDAPRPTPFPWTGQPAPPPQTSTSSYKVGGEVPGQTGRYFLKSDNNPFVLEVMKGNVSGALDKAVDTVFGNGKAEAG